MKLEPTTDEEQKLIMGELEHAKSRPRSSDFLDGFPGESVQWFRGTLEQIEFQDLYLFWTGSAWNETMHRPPRHLREGVEAFVRMERFQSSNDHLKEARQWRDKCKFGQFRFEMPFLILGGQDQHSRLMILDGNHRAAGILWWAIEGGDLSTKPLGGWVGLSSNMICYPNYSRVLQTR